MTFFLHSGSIERAESILLEIVSLQPAFIEAWDLLFTCLSDVETVNILLSTSLLIVLVESYLQRA